MGDLAPHLDAMARAIFVKALAENRCGELMECLFEGGSATIDACTGQLVLYPASVISAVPDDA